MRNKNKKKASSPYFTMIVFFIIGGFYGLFTASYADIMVLSIGEPSEAV